jgi:branched-chain amino acid transport system permease protein
MALTRIIGVIACLAIGLGVVLFGSAVQNDWLFRATTLTMLAMSWNLMANAGLVSLGHSAFWGIGSYATVLSMNKFGLPFGVGFIPAIVAGTLLGVFLAATTGRLRGIFFAISTLALSEGLRVMALMVPQVTGGAVGIFLKNDLRPPPWALHMTGFLGAVLCVLVAYILSRSRFHYASRGMRANEMVVQMLGVDPWRYRFGVMAISGAMASFAGAIYACYGGYLEPELAFSLHFTILSQIAPILGGIHTLAGPVLGSVAIIFISEVTRIWLGNREGWSLLIYGLILVICIMFMRDGILGIWRDVMRRDERRRGRAAAALSRDAATETPQ